jgi:hypothetical protein
LAKFSHKGAVNGKKELHVAALLLLLLPATSLTINNVTDVAPFPDLSIKSEELGAQNAEWRKSDSRSFTNNRVSGKAPRQSEHETHTTL